MIKVEDIFDQLSLSDRIKIMMKEKEILNKGEDIGVESTEIPDLNHLKEQLKGFELNKSEKGYERFEEIKKDVIGFIDFLIRLTKIPGSFEKIFNSASFEILQFKEGIISAKEIREDEILILEIDEIYAYDQKNKAFLNYIRSSLKGDIEDKIPFLLNSFYINLLENKNAIRDLCDNYLINLLVNFKIYLIDGLFPDLIDLYVKTNNLGINNKADLISDLIDHYENSLRKNQQLSCFQSFILGDIRFNICKKTSDNYAREIILVFKSKLRFYRKFNKENKELAIHDFKTELPGQAIQPTIEKDQPESPGKIPEFEKIIENCLRRVLEEKPDLLVKDPEKEILSVDEAADYLGLSKQTVYQHVHKRKIPHSKRGRRLFFRRSELNDWLDKGRKKTIPEIDDDVREYMKGNRDL